MEGSSVERQADRTEVPFTCKTCEQEKTTSVRSAAPEWVYDLAARRDLCEECGVTVRADREKEEAEEERVRGRRQAWSRLLASGMDPALLKEASPGAGYEPHRRAAWAWANGDGPPCLVLYGDRGQGKTVLAAQAFAKRLEARPGFWRSSTGLVRDLFGAYESQERTEAEWIARGRAMLVLDDLDKPRDTDAAVEGIFTVVDALYQARTPCIVTCNDSVATMGKRGGRWPLIASRLTGMSVQVEFRGVDHRASQARHIGMAA